MELNQVTQTKRVGHQSCTLAINIFCACYTIWFHILHITVFMQKQLSHVLVHPLAVVHACVMSGRTVNNEISCVRIGNNEYLQSVKEESIQFLIDDVVPLQDFDLVVNMHEQRGGREGQTQYTH